MNERGERNGATARFVRSLAMAIVPSLITYALQRTFWSTLSPFAWFLFYPTVFISSWFGGVWSGVGATILSAVLVWWSFLPPEGSFRIEDPKYLVSTAAYLAMGLVFAVFHERLRRARRQRELALASAEHANDALKKVANERRIFAALIENSSDFIGIADASGKPVYLNPAGRRMVGLPADRAVEDTQIPDYYPPEQRAFASDVIVKGMVEDGHWSGETSFRNWQTEGAIPVSDTHFMIREPETGEILGMGTVTRDISERKRVEAEQQFLAQVSAVLASTIDFEETLASVAALVVRELAECCIIDLVEEGGRVRRLRAVHGDPTMTAITEGLQAVALDPHRPHLASSVLETTEPLVMNEVTDEYLASIAQSDEHARLLRGLAPKSLMAVPLMAHGNLLGALVFVRTSSTAPYTSSDLRLAKELATRAALAVYNARLYAKAQRATKARDEVLGIVAHDLRNPLNSILIQTQLLQRGRREGDRRSPQGPEAIRKAVMRMNHLIQDLLDVTQIEAARLSVRCRDVPAHQIVLDALEGQRALVAAAGLELTLDVARDLPAVVADHDRVLQVVENLVGNSLKFTPSGGRITVGAEPREGEVLFWVRDTGNGINAESLPHVFDRFWQAKKGSHRGAGLGLAIVRGIVEAHRGRIWVESAVGQGTTFFFTLPVATAAYAPEAAALH